MAENRTFAVMPTSDARLSQGHQARYLRSLTLTNVRTFKSESKLDLCFPDGKVAQWTIILGENGTGKTTLLQYIAGMVPVQDARLQGSSDSDDTVPVVPLFSVGKYLSWHYENLSHPKNGKKTLTCQIELSAPASSLRKIRGSPLNLDFCATYALEENGKLHMEVSPQTEQQWALLDEFEVNAYGAGRHVANPASPYMTSDSFQSVAESPSSSIFNDELPLISPEQWLLNLDHQTRTDIRKKKAFEAACDCLKDVLPDVSKITVEPHGMPHQVMSVLFHTHYGKVTFAGFSLGYRATAAWVIDFLRRMYLRYENLDKPQTGPAIALIDEFDLHMHVQWQTKMMSKLSRTFPNTQFIITAHSPLVVQAADGKANIAVLKRVRKKGGHQEVRIDNEPRYIHGWRVDQLVSSDLFSHNSARARKYDKLVRRFDHLVEKEKLTKREAHELELLTEKLDQEAPPDASPAQLWLRAQRNGKQPSAKSATRKRAA